MPRPAEGGAALKVDQPYPDVALFGVKIVPEELCELLWTLAEPVPADHVCEPGLDAAL
jgi:hypothetical protein